MKRIDHPEEVRFWKEVSTVKVFDGMWEPIEGLKPLKWTSDPQTPSDQRSDTITLKDIEEQYKNKCGCLTVVYETYLEGAVYRLGNYSDGCWYEVGKLSGFA